MANALIISEKYVKNNSIIDENVDVKLLRPIIWESQSEYIEPILGTDLYNKILTDIAASTLTGNYLTLVDSYVAPCLLNYTLLEFSFAGLYKLRNKHVAKKNSENATPVDFTEHRSVNDHFRDKAERRRARLVNYLCENQTLFPELETNEGLDELKPARDTYTVPFFLGGKSSYKCWRDKQ